MYTFCNFRYLFLVDRFMKHTVGGKLYKDFAYLVFFRDTLDATIAAYLVNRRHEGLIADWTVQGTHCHSHSLQLSFSFWLRLLQNTSFLNLKKSTTKGSFIPSQYTPVQPD
jgi:hypothetical protein